MDKNDQHQPTVLEFKGANSSKICEIDSWLMGLETNLLFAHFARILFDKDSSLVRMTKGIEANSGWERISLMS
jgi:hypothetical protein